MTLKEDWQLVLTKAWSMRLIVLSCLLSGLEASLPMIQNFIEPLQIVPQGAFAIAALLVSMSAAVSRLISQPRSGI